MTSYSHEAVQYWENSALDGRIYGVAPQQSSFDVENQQREPCSRPSGTDDRSGLTSLA
jgi:hypothetical protein